MSCLYQRDEDGVSHWFHSAEPVPGAGPGGTAPNHHKIGLRGIPEKEALGARVISPEHLLWELNTRALQQS